MGWGMDGWMEKSIDGWMYGWWMGAWMVGLLL